MESLNASHQRENETQDARPSGTKPAKLNRPANGFLGFCHMHRVIVSRKNKKIENRLVTKILGNWWSTLTDEQKAPYEKRACDYKEWFLKANPDFKWYTPRESSGNTPVTRQSNRRGRKLECAALATGTAITPGKLADLSQMGSLNTLMALTADPTKKRSAYETSYIESEHDYLKPPIVNNNTIMAGDELTCTSSGCSQHRSVDTEDSVADDKVGPVTIEKKMKFEPLNTNDFPEPSPDVTGSSAKKRKTYQPKKNAAPSISEKDDDLTFKDFMKVCPVYQYEVFLQKKAETSKNAKKALAKRRKRQVQALKGKSGAAEAVGSAGTIKADASKPRRKKGPTMQVSVARNETETNDEVGIAQHETETIAAVGENISVDFPAPPTSPSGLLLLLTAAAELAKSADK